jgi:intracellular sulfur oxidation DsrE/DsrF family protein
MDQYLLIASRDPFTARDVDGFYDLAAGLAARGHSVGVFLVQNGVLAARRVAAAEPLTRLARSGVTVLADEFSLRERGIDADRLASGIRPAEIGHVVDALTGGARVLWS